jgi:hypothetical protein
MTDRIAQLEKIKTKIEALLFRQNPATLAR